MATIPTHSSVFISLMNQTLTDSNSSVSLSTNEQFIHLFILISVWFVLIITILCGTVGNLLVLYVYVNRNDNKTCTFFIKILAIVDLIICLILAPLELYQITIGIRNEFICKFYGYLNIHILYSTLLITIIAFDRYFCICWPLYRIITIDRARLIVIICGAVTSLLAIIPMKEYSTLEHVLHIHNNHTKYLQIDNINSYELPEYAHVEHLKGNALVLPFTFGNITNVKCSPRFSLHVEYSKFLNLYRLFHTTLFALCMLIVLVLYSFIYNAIYKRRRNRTRKFSRYRKILQSYLISSNSSSMKTHSNFRSMCCWRKSSSNSNSSLPNSIEYLSKSQTCQIKPMANQIFLEVQGARGKRYSAVSMTSMTYLTSGVWDETSPRSRVNSITANHFCGTEQITTDESIGPLRSSFHLTVPKFQTNVFQDQQINENETRKSIVRKPSQSLSLRHTRSSDCFAPQRKVSFMATTTHTGLLDQCIIEDPVSTNENPNEDDSQQQQQQQLRSSIYSARRFSVFDNETKLIFERQQRQERLANIRTTLTLFIVTATFILMYLPSIVISLFNIKPNEFREVLFLLYYINSACNPLIYSFFNVNFRNDIRRIYECQKREYFARQ